MKSAYIKDVLENRFDEVKFKQFCADIFKTMDEPSTSVIPGNQLPSDFQSYISKYVRLGKYTDPNGDIIDALVVYLSSDSAFNARTRQRNFARNYLRQRNKQALLMAFVHPGMEDWRFSYVKLDYKAVTTDNGRVRDIEELTPAKRYSFLVGSNEHSHTAQKQLSNIIEQTDMPLIAQIESVFSTTSVTNDFYDDYKSLYEKLTNAFKQSKDFKHGVFDVAKISPEDFSKKLMGQIVFLYFLQKKGWLGVARNAKWGAGDKNFLLSTLQECLNGGEAKKERGGKNYFNDYLEHLFYDTLNNRDRGNSSTAGDQSYSRYFNSRIPYLNGGLFEPIYDWRNTYIDIDNHLFKEIIEKFNQYNFTVHESTPLETDVAIDPEILGRVFEKLQIQKEQKDKGAFYTPANIVHYMSRSTIVQYLADHSDVPKEELENFIVLKDEVFADKKQLDEIDKAIPNIVKNAKDLNKLLIQIKVIDPAVGSGAFPMGLLIEITGIRRFLNERYIKEQNSHGELLTEYEIKKQVLVNSIYGVDRDPSAIEISRLRFWLSLVVEYNLEDIEPLPNLDYKLIVGDSLLKLPYLNSPRIKEDLQNVELLKETYFSINDIEMKNKQKKVIAKLIGNIYSDQRSNIGYEVSHDYRVAFSEVFQGDNPGFDIVIANPPYVSTKGLTAEYKKILKSKVQYGFSDDLYFHFFVKGLEIAKRGAVLCYITSDTFLTTVTKRNLRRTLESKQILELIKTSNVFENAMVSPAITMLRNIEIDNYKVTVKDAVGDFNNPKIYSTPINTFREAVNNVLFLPTPYNMRLYNSFNHRVSNLMDVWWDRIKTSSDIGKNQMLIEEHVKNLRPGDLTLLGLITDGGQGLATANNGKFVGVREGTKEADEIRNNSRAKKLLEARDKYKKPLFDFASKREAQSFLGGKTEQEIWQLFDDMKLKHGRDVFGQGYLYRIVPKTMIAIVENLIDDEKKLGIDPAKPTFVPYDKGDKGGNRWYLQTPFVINWSKENVTFLKKNSGKKGSGMPVVRNSKFYFREGLCWSDVHTIDIKSRLKNSGVYDVKSMSLFSKYDYLNDDLLVVILNSNIISKYVFAFINHTSSFQINDARQLPIVIPTKLQGDILEEMFKTGVKLRKLQDNGDDQAGVKLIQLQQEVDKLVEGIYIGKDS